MLGFFLINQCTHHRTLRGEEMAFTICTYLIFPKFLGSNDLQSVMTNVSHLDRQLISGTYQLDPISALNDL